MSISKPNIQEGEIVREMTEQEYEALIASGWTMEGTDEIPTPDSTADAE